MVSKYHFTSGVKRPDLIPGSFTTVGVLRFVRGLVKDFSSDSFKRCEKIGFSIP